MFKKTLLVVALAVTSSMAMADEFYAGLGAGLQNLNDKVTDTTGGSFNSGTSGFVGGVYGGYGFNFANQFNLALEAFGDFTTAKITLSPSSSYTATLKERYNYGVRALPGYQITADSDAHLILGYVRGNFRFTNTNPAVGNSTFNLNGFQMGGGLGTNLMKSLTLRADVVYNNYSSKTINGFENKPRSTATMVSLAYKFG